MQIYGVFVVWLQYVQAISFYRYINIIHIIKDSLMNEAHIHLILNHFPIILPMIAILARLSAFVFKSESLKRFALILLVLGAIASFAAMQSGEKAEEIIENMSFFSEQYLEAHEEAAETYAIFSYIVGGLSLVALWAEITKKKFRVYLTEITMALCIMSLYFAQKTGNTGGQIRHEEIRQGFVVPQGAEKED